MGLVAAPSTANAQASGGCNLTGSDGISDRVAGTFSITDAADGSARLEAVILARGRPGWAGDSPPSGIYESPPPPPGGRVRLLAGGGVGRLMLVYERFTGVAWVGSRPVRLGADNVVLVDRADSLPVIVGTRRITPPFEPGGPACAIEDAEAVENRIKAALAREPSVRTFMTP